MEFVQSNHFTIGLMYLGEKTVRKYDLYAFFVAEFRSQYRYTAIVKEIQFTNTIFLGIIKIGF